ncbi:MAG: anion permease [Betaproteobacteria bacterium]|nr:anion permease [Betaproteobacteria bacterium]
MSDLTVHAIPSSGETRNLVFVAAGLAMMAATMLMPTPAGLSLVGQRVIAVMAFTVFMWITEAIPLRRECRGAEFLLIVSLGGSPASGLTGAAVGTDKAIPMALSEFSNSGWLFVAAGLAMAAAITSTGRETRVVFLILRLVGTRVNAMMLGIIPTSFALTFLILSVIARAATIVPIVIGLIEAFGLPRTSQVGKAMLLLAGILPSVVTGVGAE